MLYLKTSAVDMFSLGVYRVDMLMNEVANKMQRPSAAEMGYRFAIPEHNNCWKSAYVIKPGKFHIFAFVNLHFYQLDPALFFFHGFQQVGCKYVAGAAPVRPEIDQYRNVMRLLYHFCMEIRQVDVDEIRVFGVVLVHHIVPACSDGKYQWQILRPVLPGDTQSAE